jgi:hypothetical protein
MNRIILVRMIIVIVLLSGALPFLPSVKDDPLGIGGFQDAWAMNKGLLELPGGDLDRRAELLFSGNLGFRRIKTLLEAVEEVRAEGLEADTHVQTLGFPRNVNWILAYYLYPVRVIGRSAEDGGRYDDEVLPEADWKLIGSPKGTKLERVH